MSISLRILKLVNTPILQEVNRIELCINGTKVFNVSDSKVYMYNLSVCLQFLAIFTSPFTAST